MLKNFKHGIEREVLRIDDKGRISKTPHSSRLGSSLTNSFITTDFSEAQLELITPPSSSLPKNLKFLENIHTFVSENLEEELLWPFCMPPALPKNEEEIPLAEFGNSEQGKKKHIYRRGLSARYGRKMQTVSGIHYNFSFSEEFWKELYKKRKSKKTLQQFIDDSYFHIIRNFLRYRCVITYFFGASPVIDKSYLPKKELKKFKKLTKDSYYLPEATSIRTSFLGYNSKVQQQIFVSYDNLEAYIKDLKNAVTTPSPIYKKMGIYNKKGEQIQLNVNLLQLEAEHYSSIRPKQTPQKGESACDALRKRGVQYLEVRPLDIDPYSPIGLNEDALLFIQMLLIYCLFEKSPLITKEEAAKIMEMQNKVALFGLKGFCIPTARKIISKLEEIAQDLDKESNGNKYSETLKKQSLKLEDPSLTPAAKIIQDIKKSGKSYLEFGINLAKKHRKTLQKNKLSDSTRKLLEKEAKNSLKKQEKLEIELEGSTQLIIKEAQKRNIEVEVLDRSENFIRLTKGKKTEYIKQANFTSLDSQITYFILGNKNVQKQILQENGISAPTGRAYNDANEAFADYSKYRDKKIVVKPTTTNYGISINFIEANQEKAYQEAVKDSFKYDKTIIVEEFIKGNEYRFLVIGNKVASVLYRRPASVLGDGKQTIAELVKIKNADPQYYKNNTGQPIKLGKVEKEILKEQKLNLSSIPKKGRRIFLRKNSNIHSGGDPIEVSDRIPEFYKKIALESAKAVKAKICGIDMIISDLKKKPSHSTYSIIELNYNPAIQMHHFTVESKGKAVEKDILDLLDF